MKAMSRLAGTLLCSIARRPQRVLSYCTRKWYIRAGNPSLRTMLPSPVGYMYTYTRQFQHAQQDNIYDIALP